MSSDPAAMHQRGCQIMLVRFIPSYTHIYIYEYVCVCVCLRVYKFRDKTLAYRKYLRVLVICCLEVSVKPTANRVIQACNLPIN